jgi:hypothetical protein
MLVPVKIPLMNEAEVREIVSSASDYLANAGLAVDFNEASVRKIWSMSGGFPWYVHRIGQRGVVSAHDEGLSEIDTGVVEQAAKFVVELELDQQFHGLYLQAVGNSQQRELTLRMMAKWDDEFVPTQDVYRMLKAAGVSNPSNYRLQLEKEAYGSILYVPPVGTRAVIAFRSGLFKVYVRLRSALYEGVDEQVDRAYRGRV